MTFQISHLSAKQLEAFSSRLAKQLEPAQARTSLAGLLGAFSNAAGFLNYHAVSQQQKHRKAELVSGLSSSLMEQVGTSGSLWTAHQIKAWARQSWKHQRELLKKDPFTRADTQTLLCQIWGYENWSQLLQRLLEEQTPATRFPGLLFGSTMDDLERQGGRCGPYPAFSRVHSVLGKMNEGQAMGLSMEAAWSHLLIMDDNTHRRGRLVSQIAQHRLACGEAVIVVDASADQTLSFAALKDAERKVLSPTIVDLREHLELPWPAHAKDPRMTQTLAAWLSMVTSPEDQNWHIGWAACVNVLSKNRLHPSPFDIPAFTKKVLSDPFNEAAWWTSVMGVNDVELLSIQNLWRKLSEPVKDLLDTIRQHLPTLPMALDYHHLNGVALNGHGLVVFQLPCLAGKEGPSLYARLASCLAWSLIKGCYQERLEEEDEKNKQPRVPRTLISLDVDFQSMDPGSAVLPSQLRHTHTALVHAMPYSGIPSASDSILAKSWLANIGAKLLFDSAGHKEDAHLTIANQTLKIHPLV